MIKKNLKQIFSILLLVFMLTLPFLVFAQGQGVLGKLQTTASYSGYSPAGGATLAATLGIIVNSVLSLLGIVFIILIIIGGFQWMTAGGNEEQVKKAQGRIKNAVIGLVIVLSAYAIWSLIDRFFIMRSGVI